MQAYKTHKLKAVRDSYYCSAKFGIVFCNHFLRANIRFEIIGKMLEKAHMVVLAKSILKQNFEMIIIAWNREFTHKICSLF